MRKTSYKRRRVLVDRQVQGALARRIALHWLCFMSLSISITCLLCAIANFDKLTFFESVLSSLKAQAGSIVVLLAFLPWFLRDAIELSHRFAGPMVRLRHAMKGLANGEEIPPIVFRRGDFWMDVADEMNRVREVVLFGKNKCTVETTDGLPTKPIQLEAANDEPAQSMSLPILPVQPLSSSLVSHV